MGGLGAGRGVRRLSERSPPNVLVVVLDCGRADDLPGGSRAVTNMPFADGLRRESLWFPRAVSPAPWTVPSHASLFTGLYPWEHGAHAKGTLKLPEGIPRLPALLHERGYRTFSLSANHLISPDLGLSEGFDRSAWAGWWEPYYRTSGNGHPPHASGNGVPTHNSRLHRLKHGPTWEAVKLTSRVVYRFPFVTDAAGRLRQRLRDPGGRETPGVSSWIEPTFDRWLGETPPSTPVFAFVNLLEVHEPYYPVATWRAQLADWVRDSRDRQDHIGWLAGAWKPSAQEYDRLHELCRDMLAEADRRLAGLAAVLQRHGRWEDTTVVITSDHGQGFGEHDILFHMLRLEEPLVRIPLWIRRPRRPELRGEGRGWASLVDVAPSLLEDAGASTDLVSSGFPLGQLKDAARPSPVLSAADGLVWKTIIPEHERGRVSDQRKRAFDRILVAAYDGSTKVVYDAAEDRVRAYDVTADPGEARDLWPERSAELAGLAAEARSVAGRMLHGPEAPVPDDVEDRLRSWGYI
ncbi:MAG TPA: sulfatase-like hydrolase/transferase [Thermoplasmata archaeon]|nr:sulfatase-like hydrolase/transferase [Thermoplasmata archaeon]